MPWTFYNSNGQRLSSAATNISVLDIDGATEMGADIIDADLLIIDDGAGGTNKSVLASRLKTYVGSALTRPGGNLTEATTTSTSAVDLVSVTSLNIEEINFISGRSLHRKTSGAEADAGGGLKLNSTVIAEAVGTGAIGLRLTGVMATTNSAFSGVAEWNIPATVTNYAIAGATGISAFGGGSYVTYAGTSARPASANITSVITRAITLSASNTWGHDEVHVYTWAAS